MQARVHDIQRIQLQVLHGNAHAGGKTGSICALELNAYALAVFEHQQVKLRALVRGPKIGLVWLGDTQHLFEREALPACPTSAGVLLSSMALDTPIYYG